MRTDGRTAILILQECECVSEMALQSNGVGT